MQRVIQPIMPAKTMRKGRAVKRFCMEQANKGITFTNYSVPELLFEARTVAVDSSLIMEGKNAVRLVTAPMIVCPVSKLKKQSAWMMLTAGVALGCEDYKPLEDFIGRVGFERGRLIRQYPPIQSIGYDDARRLETTLHRDANGMRAFTKGEPEAVLSRCAQVLDGRQRVLSDVDRKMILGAAHEIEQKGLETLAFATKWQAEPGEPEREMTFLGIVGMGDLPDPLSPMWMDWLRDLGIRPILISREHLTRAAARMTGVVRLDAEPVYSAQIQNAEDERLETLTKTTDAYLGCSNAQRRKILRAFRKHETVPLVLPSPEGGVAISTGLTDEDDVTIRHGNFDEAVKVFQECHALLGEA